MEPLSQTITSERLVSVIVPTYNSARFITEALDSVFSQNFQAFEIIVVDDGSTDETAQVIQPYLERISFVRQENSGSAAARNTGLELAKGEYIVFLDADDIMLPGKLTEQVAFLERRPWLGMVHSGWQVIDEKGRVLETVEPWHEAPHLDLETWFTQKPIRMGAMMYHRPWLETVGGLDPTIRQSHDVDLMLRLALSGCQVEWLYRPTISYRFYPTSTIRQGALKHHGYVVRVFTKFMAAPNLPDSIRKIASRIRYYNLRWLAWHMYESGFTDAIVSPLEQGFLYAPQIASHTAVEIVERFVKFLAASGRDPQELVSILPHIQRAGHISDGHWTLIEAFVRWWLRCWPASQQWPYQNLDDLWQFWHRAAQHERRLGVSIEIIASWWVDVWMSYLFTPRSLMETSFQPFAHIPLDALLSMSQLCLVHKPDRVDPAKIDRFWQDMMAAGLVNKNQQNAVTTLYLTHFGQQLLGQHWLAAITPLSRALKRSLSRAGRQAWWKFGQAAAAYRPIGLQSKPHLLLASLAATPDDHFPALLASCHRAGWLVSAASPHEQRVYSWGLSEEDWLPAEALSGLATRQPINHGHYLRQFRKQNGRMRFYRQLPLIGHLWQLIYFSSLTEAVANTHVFELGYPVMVRVQGKDDGNLAGEKAGAVIQRVTAFHCTSRSAQEWLVAIGVPSRKTYLVCPGVDCDYFVPVADTTADHLFRLVVASPLDWGGGFEYALQAVQGLAARGIALHLDIVGNGPDYDRVMYTIHDLQLSTVTCVHKRADPETIRQILQQADVFLLSPVQDALPPAMLRAMACGLPIVATDLPAIREVITNGIHGHLVPPREPAELATALAELASQSAYCRQLGIMARQRIEADFTARQEQTGLQTMLTNMR